MIEVVAWLVAIAWMTVLTVVALTLLRQVSVLQLYASTGGGSNAFDVNSDGPAVGSDVPVSITADEWWPEHVQFLILILSATCGPCRAVVDDLKQTWPLPSPLLVFVAGREELSSPLVAELSGLDSLMSFGEPLASDVSQQLGVQSSPFVLAVREGRIAGKAYVRELNDIVQLASRLHEEDLGIST